MHAEPLLDIPEPWFALRVKSRREKAAATIARDKEFEESLAFYQSRRCWPGRLKSVELRLFPDYIFRWLNPRHRLALLTIPGGFEDQPAAALPRRSFWCSFTAVLAKLITEK